MAADAGTLAPTVVAQIDQMAASSPQNVAVHSLDGTLTYAELTVVPSAWRDACDRSV